MLMRLILVFVIIFAGCRAPVGPAQAIGQHYLKVNPGVTEVRRVDLVNFPTPQGEVYVAAVDAEASWWGTFYCFGMNDNGLAWVAEHDHEICEQSVVAVGGGMRSGHREPLIEVFGETHQGNGSLYVYRLVKGRLELVLKTWAVRAGNSFGNTLHHGRLASSWEDRNDDGIADLHLHGRAYIFEPDRDKKDVVVRQEKIERTFIFDPKQLKFAEQVSARRGLLKDGDMQ